MVTPPPREWSDGHICGISRATLCRKALGVKIVFVFLILHIVSTVIVRSTNIPYITEKCLSCTFSMYTTFLRFLISSRCQTSRFNSCLVLFISICLLIVVVSTIWFLFMFHNLAIILYAIYFDRTVCIFDCYRPRYCHIFSARFVYR